MSTFTESLLQAADEGNLEDFKVTTTPAEEESAPMPTVDQHVVEAMSQVNSEIETGKYIEGTAASIGVELGTGIGMQYMLNKYRPAMRFLRGASHVSKLGIVAPEGGSTIAGIVGLVGTEALIWGGSNLLGQAVRKSYGIQEEFSAGEAIAASVFGTTFVFDKVNKGVFALGRPAIGKETWKGRNLVVNGTKTFVSGAALGMAESALRQSTQLLLNERDNFDEYDLLLSGGIGGAMNTGMNTLFTAWSKTGAWGRGQAEKAVRNAKENLTRQKEEVKETIKKAKEPLPDNIKYSWGGGYAQTGKEVGLRNALNQLRDIEQAEAVIDDSLNGLIKANEAISAREKNPVPLKKDVVDDAPTQPKVTGFKTQGDPFEVGDRPIDIGFLRAGGKITVMTPDEYIDMAMKADPKRSRKDIVDERLEDVEGMERNRKAIKEGSAIPLMIDTMPDGTVLQEGLKRALAAKELGLTEVPVIVDASKFKPDAPTPPKTPTPPKAPTKETLSDPDDDELNALIKRWESIDSETVSNEGVRIHRDAERFSERTHRRLGENLVALSKNADNTEAVGNALDAVVTLRKLNSKLLDLSKTAGGRLVQGSRRDSNRYNWEGKFSQRALKEDEALNKLENSLRERLDGGEETDLSKLMKDYLGVKPEVEKAGKKLGKKKPVKELTPEQAAKKSAKEKETLKKKLETLQKRFGDDAKLKPKDAPKKKEADAEIEDLKARIKFHEANERDAIRLGERLKERERLLAVETGPLGAQRAEVSKKPTGPKKTPGRLEQVEADIAFLKKNMRNRVQEIDKAAKEITPEFQAEKIRKAYEAKVNRLEKELNQRRERFGDLEQARAKAGMPKLPEDPKIKDLEDRVKFYRDAEAEALKVVELEKELARVADVEGRGIMGELRAETAPKPKGPTKPSRSDELRKKIQQSKARMKKRVADIDKAQAEINAAQQRMEIYGNYREHFDAALNKDGINVISQFFNRLQLMRQLALIDQLPSVFAGLGTNFLATFKQFFRPVGGFLANVTLNQTGMTTAIRYAQADLFGAMKMLTDLKGLGTAVKRTFQQNLGVTTQTVGKFSDEVSQTALPRGEAALIAKAWNDSKRQAEAVTNLGNVFGRWVNSRNFWHILSLGVRGIQSVDEVFKRQIIKGRMWSEATKNGIRKFPNDPVKAEKYAKELYESAWRDNDGLAVLDDVSNFYDEINQVNEELLFASNVDRVEDVYEPFSEAIIRTLNKLSDTTNIETSQILGNLIRAFMVYIGVPIRGAYRLGHYSLPFMGVLKATVANPYSSKIKRFSNQLKAAQDSLRKETNPDRIKGLEDAIQELTEKVETATARRAKYNSEALTDLMVGTGLFATGYLAATEGGMTGGLSWMTDDQKENNKLKPYDALGVNYVANMPWSGPLALGADMAVWDEMKKSEDESGLPILQKDQDRITVMRSSITSLLAEQPLTAGYKTGKELATGTDEMVKNATAKLLSSYIPIPAQVRKITQTVTSDGTVDDLRGATFYERVAYHTLGTGPANKKTDRLGEPEQSPRTFLTQNITRLAPQKEVVRTKLDEVLATDNYQQVSGKPTTLAPGIKMTEWRNEDGLTLEYAFSLKLREIRIGNQTISEAVDKLLESKSFKRRFEKPPTQTLDGRFQNEGLKMLNDELRKYYNRTKKEILKDERFMSSFVDKDDRNLLELYEQTGVKLDVGGRPQSVFELLNE